MLKVVVYDSGFGGELFADRLETELPVLEVIRVIDWRHANQIQSSPRAARKLARIALKQYIGKVDLIIFANHLLSLTSLRYFKRHYRGQKFVGFTLKRPDTFLKRDVLILATKPITRTINYYNFLFQIKRRTKTLSLDTWPAKIDDGELTDDEIRQTFLKFTLKCEFRPTEIVLACAQFNDIKPELRTIFGANLKIYDSFDDAIRKICKTLKIRGGTGKKRK